MKIVDRIEGELAVVELEDGGHEDVPVSSIEGRVRDGAVLAQDEDGNLSVDEEATEERLARIKEKMDKLFI